MDVRFEKLKCDLLVAVDGMSREQLNWHPAGKWCAAEVLEHVYLTYTGTILGFERVMRKGTSLVSRANLSQRLVAFVVLGLGHIPAGRRAPAMTLPKGLPVEKVCSDLERVLGELDTIIAQCAARFGDRVKILDHPLLGPLTAAEWRKLHVVHGHHHLKQILRLRRDAMIEVGQSRRTELPVG